MGGGYFDYGQHRISEIADKLEALIERKPDAFDWTPKQDFSPETIAEFRNALIALNTAYTYAHRIDWLLSGDDSEETFHKRLKESLGG